MEELKKYILKNYHPQHAGRTCMSSSGNDDDVFSDGEERGIALTLKQIGNIIGLELEMPAQQEFE